MSYGIIRAWKSATEYERVEHFLLAIIESDKAYLHENCSSDIEFVDVVDNLVLKGIEPLMQHVETKWGKTKDSFEIAEIELSYTDKSESASFTMVSANRETIGLLAIEVSNGRISHCKLALNYGS